MAGPVYPSLLQHQALSDLRANKRGNLEGLTWTEDGAPCHVINRNMAYLDRQFGNRVRSRNPIRLMNWPAPRSPYQNPCDVFLWPFLKSKVYSPCPTTLDQLDNNIRTLGGLSGVLGGGLSGVSTMVQGYREIEL